MTTERLEMRKIREILRLRAQGRSVREVARSLGISVGAVQKTASRAVATGLTWELAEAMDEPALEERLYGVAAKPGADRARPDPVYMHKELRRTGVTLELLHLEYLEAHPTGLRHTAFCEVYRRWLAKVSVVMRQVHKGAEKCFVDYSGAKPAYFDPQTGQQIEVEVFVAVLGASNYTYAEATMTQQVPDFIGAHTRAFQYFGGVTEVVVPDQLKSAVVKSCRYEPGIQRSYAEMARHYGTAIVPARPHKPRDKAKVEVAVQIAQRWILGRLRNQSFFSLGELNQRIAELLEDLNLRPMKKLGGVTRRELYERYDRPALRALPSQAYEISVWREVTVNTDYHIEYEKHWYSAPYQLVKQTVWVRATVGTVELYHRGQRVASHPRDAQPYKHTTAIEHMPQAHQHQSKGVDAVVAWGMAVGPMTAAMVERLLAANPVREQGWRSARGLQRVGEKHGPERMELACERALKLGARSYKVVANILSLKRENLPLPGEEPRNAIAIEHENVRGSEYYH